MKFTRLMLTTGAALATATLALGCSATPETPEASGSPSASDAPHVITVAAVSTPMTDVVLAAAAEIEEGYEIELVELGDYPVINNALAEGEVDASFSQHIPYMEDFNEANGADLVAVQPIYDAIVSFYSREYRSWDELPERASIFIPGDPTNTGRALDLLAQGGVITLDPEVARFEAGLGDIIENPKEVQFTEVGFSELPVAYPEADAVFMYYAFARMIDLTPEQDTIASETDGPFSLQLVTRSELAGSPEIEALKRAFTTERVREVIIESGNTPVFDAE